MEYFNGYFIAKFPNLIQEIVNQSEYKVNLKDLDPEKKNQEEILKIKLLYKTYKTNMELIKLSRIFTINKENGNQAEIEINLGQDSIKLYDKFMQIFNPDILQADNKKSLFMDKKELLSFTNLVFKYDLVIQIQKYFIDTIINHYSFFTIDQLEALAKKYQISELNDFIQESKTNLSNLITKVMNLPRNEGKTTSLKM